MPSVVHCLGELEYIYDKYNLKLRTNGCISLSFPFSDYTSPSNVHELDTLISYGTRIAGTNQLRLHVELRFDDIAVTGSSISQTTEDIGVVLCSAELWSQLCLDASLTINDSNKFLISLSAHASTNANIIPTSHIPSMCLEDIGITFHFSSCRRTRQASKAQGALSGSGVQPSWVLPTGSDDEHLDRPLFSTFPSPGGSQSSSDTLADKYAPWIPIASSIRASPLSSQGSVPSNTHNTPSHNNSPISDIYVIQEIKFETLIKLVNSSLRRMISDCKMVRQGGIVLSNDDGYPKLATISPTLFSPGYVKAISHRSSLLLTIVRTISCTHRRTNSSRLRHKLSQLQELSLNRPLDHGSIKDFTSSNDICSSSVEVRLWFLTQSKLFDPLACRGLKPLNIFNKTGLGSQEMLDESVDDVEDTMLDGDEARIFDSYGDAMELDETNHADLFHEHSLDEFAHEGEEPWDNNNFWQHSQDDVSYDTGETLDDDTTSSANDELHVKLCRAS